jgi:nitrate reductase NapE component
MARERILKTVLVLVGLLFPAAAYPAIGGYGILHIWTLAIR